MKLNELVCPVCGQKCLTDCAYTRCDRCNTTFYASQQLAPPMQTVMTRIYIDGRLWPFAPSNTTTTGGFNS